ncbi:MAG: Stp1/IreP family PP2C-type Ser/Thr phosphatase [Nitrospirota bacterium]
MALIADALIQSWKSWKCLIQRMIPVSFQSKKYLGDVQRMNSTASTSYFPKKATALTCVLQPAHTIRLRPEHGIVSMGSDYSYGIKRTRTATPAVAWYGLTDPGQVRQSNEDTFSCLSLIQGTLFVIADGMGGYEAGERASKLAVDTVCRFIQENISRNSDRLHLLKNAVQAANTAVYEEAILQESKMGTTLSMVFLEKGTAFIANVGDSRVYRIEQGSIFQLTEDHSLPAKLVSLGKLTKEESRHHPQSNLLYRALGTDAEVKIDLLHQEMEPRSCFLLCTDGLWNEVDDDDIRSVVMRELDVKKICTTLVNMANDQGGMDNITVLVARVV